MTINHAFTGIPVTNYSAALAWYTRFFGRPPDVTVSDHECMWQVTATGWVYVVRDENRAGKALLTLLVDNLDNLVAKLASRGLATGDIETIPGAYRKAVVTNPEGNTISLGQDLSAHT